MSINFGLATYYRLEERAGQICKRNRTVPLDETFGNLRLLGGRMVNSLISDIIYLNNYSGEGSLRRIILQEIKALRRFLGLGPKVCYRINSKKSLAAVCNAV